MKNAEECRKACVGLRGCVGFTFVKTETERPNCAVKSSWVHYTKTSNTNCDSGRVTNTCRKFIQGVVYIS